MGTSSNQASPGTPNWRIAKSVLGRSNVPPERQSQEVWRAAVGDRGEALANSLSNPLLIEACQIAETASSPAEASRSFEGVILREHAADLTLDLARRALVRAVAASKGAEGFAGELFAEIASYYISRDLPSFVGAPDRVQSTSEAIQLKDTIRSIARSASARERIQTDPQGWRRFVERVLTNLQRGGRA